MAHPIQYQPGSIPILRIGSVYHDDQKQTDRVYQDMPLTSIDLLARVVSSSPPFSVVFTDWLSRMAALGSPSRPSWRRVSRRNVSWMRRTVPSLRQFRK